MQFYIWFSQHLSATHVLVQIELVYPRKFKNRSLGIRIYPSARYDQIFTAYIYKNICISHRVYIFENYARSIFQYIRFGMVISRAQKYRPVNRQRKHLIRSKIFHNDLTVLLRAIMRGQYILYMGNDCVWEEHLT